MAYTIIDDMMCPFCGGTTLRVVAVPNNRFAPSAWQGWIACHACQACGPTYEGTDEGFVRAAVLQKWRERMNTGVLTLVTTEES